MGYGKGRSYVNQNIGVRKLLRAYYKYNQCWRGGGQGRTRMANPQNVLKLYELQPLGNRNIFILMDFILLVSLVMFREV